MAFTMLVSSKRLYMFVGVKRTKSAALYSTSNRVPSMLIPHLRQHHAIINVIVAHPKEMVHHPVMSVLNFQFPALRFSAVSLRRITRLLVQ